MANTKISQLPSYTGTAADLRWFVMNNSGETETYKYSGYSSQLIPGSGTDSYRTVNANSTTGTNAIAIGINAYAAGNDSIFIGNANGQQAGTNSIVIGKQGQAGGTQQVIIGSSHYVNGTQAISIGTDNASYATGSIVLGNTSRATGAYGITIGNNNDRNIGTYSTILGYNNRIAEAPDYYGGQYNIIMSSNSWINCLPNSGGYNTIIGGQGNYITGTTSGATMIGQINKTLVGNLSTMIGGENNTISSTDSTGRNTIIGGYGNTISSTHTSTAIGGYGNTANGYFGGVILGRFNTNGGGVNSCIFGGESNTTNNGGAIFGSYASKTQTSNESGVNIFGGYGNRLSTNGGLGISIFGGSTNYYHAGSSIASAYSQSAGGIFGGWNNLIGDNRADSGTGSAIAPIILGGSGNTIYSTSSTYQNDWVQIIGGVNNGISGATNSGIFNGSGSTIPSGLTNVTMIGTQGKTATRSNATFVENLVVFNYAALNFANDTAAAAGGVVLGQIYHDNGLMRIRIV